jgi:exonuclease SbcC
MLIQSLELRNIKSYDIQGSAAQFAEGINLIWGENGSGKTTLVEAIGLVLFGALE